MRSHLIKILILLVMSATLADAYGNVAEPAETDSVAPDAELQVLDDLVVTATPKLVQSDGAKLTYNVTEDSEAKSSNILEILRKVPGVTVDSEDNIRVNGQSSFKILMNNQEDPMLKGDVKTVLKSIPASTILKIELISEPGAKYDAEGAGGILNIVTDRKTSLAGIFAQASAWINAYQVGGNVNARTKIKNVTASANVSYNNGYIWKRFANQHVDIEYLKETSPTGNHLQSTDRKTRLSGWDYLGANLNLSWEPDTLNLFTVGVNYGLNGWGSPYTETRSMYGGDMRPLWSLVREADEDGQYDGVGAQVSYQHTFGKAGHTLVASYAFNWAKMHSDTYYSIISSDGHTGEMPWQSNLNRTIAGVNVFQLDYTNPFDTHNTLEAGAKASINHTRQSQDQFKGESEATSLPIPGGALSLKDFRDIYALYASWSGRFDKWNVKAGLRYEYTRMGMRYFSGNHPDFTRELHDFVPNAAISFNMTSASSLRLAYQMRSSRPDLYALNPYRNTMTPGVVSYGNPELKTAQLHNISLGYSNYDHDLSGEVKLTYRYTANDVEQVIFQENNLLNITYANVGKSHAAQLDLNLNWKITSDFNWGLYASGAYEYIKAESEMLKAKKCGWSTNLNTDINYTLPSKLRLSAYGGYYSPWISLQSKGSSGYYYGLGASRSFLADDALTLSVNAGNFLPSSRTNKYVQEDESARWSSSFSYPQWNVGFNISFKFGKLKADVRRTAANVDATIDGSGGGQGGGSQPK